MIEKYVIAIEYCPYACSDKTSFNKMLAAKKHAAPRMMITSDRWPVALSISLFKRLAVGLGTGF